MLRNNRIESNTFIDRGANITSLIILKLTKLNSSKKTKLLVNHFNKQKSSACRQKSAGTILLKQNGFRLIIKQIDEYKSVQKPYLTFHDILRAV